MNKASKGKRVNARKYSHNSKNSRNSRNTKKLNINLILLIVIPILFVGTTAAKYMRENELELAYQAKNFYFKSDLLSDDETLPEYSYESGIESISFHLKNNDDSLRYSEVDIEYTVTLTKDGEEVDSKSGKLEKGEITMDAISFSDLEAGEYIVTAQATSPYEKTLTGKFTLAGADKTIAYDLVDSENSPIVELTITTQDYSGGISITYPEGVVPDSTDSKIESVTTTNVTTTFEKNGSYTFIFLKTNPATVYTIENFTVSKI